MSMNVQKTDTVIIGGGAAGMMAAITAAERGKNVIILEHEEVCGKKLRITGKGRCNVCNKCDIKTFLQNVPRNPKFLYSAINRFSPDDTIRFFEELNVPLKTERGNRVFPVSDDARDIVRALERKINQYGIKIINDSAIEILIENMSVIGVRTKRQRLECDSVLLATGGISYPLTGSTGDGYRMAAALGHSVTPLSPSLVPLVSPDPYCAEMQGLTLKNVILRVLDEDGILVFSELGEMMFTHYGVTGPLILSASAHMRDFDRKRYRLEIDLKPGLNDKKLDARLLRDFDKYKNRDFSNSLGDLTSHTMIPVLIRLSGISKDTKVNSITREQRQTLLRLLKAFPVSISGTRPIEEAIVTSGGINVQEVDPHSMCSKLVSGLYFAGEILDLDAYTGGFNLQIAWSTGRMAGMNL